MHNHSLRRCFLTRYITDLRPSRPITATATATASVLHLSRHKATISPNNNTPLPHPLPPPKNPPPSHPTLLLHRTYPTLPDFLSPTQSHLLTLTLSAHLHPTAPPPSTIRTRGELYPGYFLVYFPPIWLGEEDVLEDGSDGGQRPGGKWEGGRRMWAGGEVIWRSGRGKGKEGRLMLGEYAMCKERVVEVLEKGEKCFVKFRREYHSSPTPPSSSLVQLHSESQPAVVEHRTLVFIPPTPTSAQTAQQPPKLLFPKDTPHFSHTFLPTPHLLLRFSALTFNAHKIHYDTEFSRDVEGYTRGTLCHGPLALVVLLEFLRDHLAKERGGRRWRVRKFEYRNLAPMFVGEPYTICGMLRREGTVEAVEKDERVGFAVGEERMEGDKGRVYDLWVVTPEGGYSVKGVAAVEEVKDGEEVEEEWRGPEWELVKENVTVGS